MNVFVILEEMDKVYKEFEVCVCMIRECEEYKQFMVEDVIVREDFRQVVFEQKYKGVSKKFFYIVFFL